MILGDELQRAVYERLRADAGVIAAVGDRVFDNRPSAATFPCVTIGPSDAIDDDAEEIEGEVETLQLDCWARSNGRLGPVKPVVRAVKDALHKRSLDLVGGALVDMRITMTRVFMDPDGQTAHGVVMVEMIVERV